MFGSVKYLLYLCTRIPHVRVLVIKKILLMVKTFGRFVFLKASEGFVIICAVPYSLLALGLDWSMLHLLPFISLERRSMIHPLGRREMWEVRAGFLVFKVSIMF